MTYAHPFCCERKAKQRENLFSPSFTPLDMPSLTSLFLVLFLSLFPSLPLLSMRHLVLAFFSGSAYALLSSPAVAMRLEMPSLLSFACFASSLSFPFARRPFVSRSLSRFLECAGTTVCHRDCDSRRSKERGRSAMLVRYSFSSVPAPHPRLLDSDFCLHANLFLI